MKLLFASGLIIQSSFLRYICNLFKLITNRITTLFRSISAERKKFIFDLFNNLFYHYKFLSKVL